MEEQLTALSIYEETGQSQHVPRVLIGIGNIYQREDDFKKGYRILQ